MTMVHLKQRHLEEIKRRKESNKKTANDLFVEAGWSEYANVMSNSILIEDLYLIGKSIEDLPFINVYEIEESIKYDYVDENGITRLPFNMIQFNSVSEDGCSRPRLKTLSYMGRHFVVHYYHDGSVIDVEMSE